MCKGRASSNNPLDLPQGKGNGKASSDDPLGFPKGKGEGTASINNLPKGRRASSDDPLHTSKGKHEGRASGDKLLALPKGKGKGRVSGDDPLAHLTTSRHEASYGQWYPCPALQSFWVEVWL